MKVRQMKNHAADTKAIRLIGSGLRTSDLSRKSITKKTSLIYDEFALSSYTSFDWDAADDLREIVSLLHNSK